MGSYVDNSSDKMREILPRRGGRLLGATAAVAALAAFAPSLSASAATKTKTATVTSGLVSRVTSIIPELFPLSPFDHSVATESVVANSSSLVSNLVNQYRTNYGYIGVNRIPIFTVPATQPLVKVSLARGCYGSFLTTLGSGVPIPPGAYNSGTSDAWFVVSQPSTGQVWELWKATQANGQWSACWGGGMDALSSTGVFPAPFGMSATGISYLATTITEDDVASGQIDHAIALQIPNCDGYVSPADRTDCKTGMAGGSTPGSPPEGTWLRLPASTPMPAGLTPFAQMVFQALKTYGAVVTDHAGAVMVEAENSKDWAFQGHIGTDPITTAFAGKAQWAVFNGMPWPHLQVIKPPRL